MPAYEDEFGTYIMNSKDLRAVQHVARFCEMGIRTLKIEGRTKSHYYVARTAQVYRRAIEEAVQGKDFDMQMMDDLQTLANRGYTEGFYRRHPPAEYQGYDNQKQPTGPQRFVGEVIDANEDWLTIDVKNRFEKDETLQLMTPSGNLNFELTTLENKDGHAIDVAPGSGHLVQIRKPVKLSVEQLEYGLLVRDEN
jgi:putative protease